MANSIYFFEVSSFISADFIFEETKHLIEDKIDRLLNNPLALKIFTEEIYPIVRFADFLKVKEMRFLSDESNSIDAEFKGLGKGILKIECTTSIEGFLKKYRTKDYKNFYKEEINDTKLYDINEFVKKDIAKIQAKIDKGLNENKYNNFILILSTAHKIDMKQISKYGEKIRKYWDSLKENPFCALFITNYDERLSSELLMKKLEPIPIFFTENRLPIEY